MKKRFIIIVVIILIGSVGLISGYNKKFSFTQENLNRERYSRMVAEEELEKAKAKIGSLQIDLAKVQKKSESNQKILDETKSNNDDLQVQLEKAVKLQQDLEGKIKELNEISVNQTVNQPGGQT